MGSDGSVHPKFTGGVIMGREEAGVISVTVKFRTKDGKERSVIVDGQSSDALFWSMEAIDRFALPFYHATEGYEKAVDIRRAAEAQLAEAGMIIGPHKKYCLILLPELNKGDPSPI
jgi:hypothetical protein